MGLVQRRAAKAEALKEVTRLRRASGVTPNASGTGGLMTMSRRLHAPSTTAIILTEQPQLLGALEEQPTSGSGAAGAGAGEARRPQSRVGVVAVPA